MDPQAIIATCEANWDANKSDCNHFVKAVAVALGVTIFSDGDNADAIMDKLSGAVGWNLIGDLPTVEADATAGMFIIAGLKSADFTPPRANGHVVVVVQGDDPNHPGYPMAYWGMLGGVGQKDSSIRNSFTPNTDLPNVKYYGTTLPDSTTTSFKSQDRTTLSDSTNTSFESQDRLVDVRSTVESFISKVVETLGKDSQGDPKDRIFFPHGIDTVEIAVKTGLVDVSVKIAGPKST